jgi:predicted PurR-regulated permease PerM
VKLLAPTEGRSALQSAGVLVIAFAALVALLYYGRAVCITLVVSVILAFLLEPAVGLMMRLRVPRPVASFIVCIVALALLYFAGLALYAQVLELSDDLPLYSQRMNQLVDSVAERIERTEKTAYALLVPKRFQRQEELNVPPAPPPARTTRRTRRPVQEPPPVQEIRIRQDREESRLSFLYGYLSSIYNVALMVSFVPFLVYFMLSWRDHMRQSFLALFEGHRRHSADRGVQSIGDMARGFVVGNVILGLMLALASTVVFWSWSLPYPVLTGFLSGFLSLVPYVGLPLAIVPALLSALMMYTSVTPFVIIAAEVGLLHLLALNLLYPAVVGARVHLNPLVVTIALMFWGALWGAIGLVLAIPITAAIKALLDNNEKLQPYGRLLGDHLDGGGRP